MTPASTLAKKIAQTFGLSPRADWPVIIPKASVALAKHYGCTHAELCVRADSEPKILLDLAAYLTIGETFFLRHPKQFDIATDFLTKRYERLERMGDQRGVLALSVGCSSGEEPYSLAIVLREHLSAARMAKTRIHALDINRDAIAKARAGTYSLWSFRGTPSWLLARYFSTVKDRKCTLQESIRRKVQFERRHLMDKLTSMAPASVDMIFFRNVAIYLDRNWVEQTFKALRRVLISDGILLTAPSDPIPPYSLFVHHADPGYAVFTSKSMGTGNSKKATTTFELRRPKAPKRKPKFVRAKADHTAPALVSVDDVRRIGDAGDTALALEMTHKLIAADPEVTAGYLLRGQLLVASGQEDLALIPLRRCVFLDFDAKEARYWYAVALRACGDHARSLLQFNELEQQLKALEPDLWLVDSECLVSDLLDAVRLQKKELQ